MAVQDHVAVVSSPIAVILVMQRLVHVADEVDDELQRLRLRCPVSFGVVQDGEKLLGPADDAITVGTLARQVNLRICLRAGGGHPKPSWMSPATIP